MLIQGKGTQAYGQEWNVFTPYRVRLKFNWINLILNVTIRKYSE